MYSPEKPFKEQILALVKQTWETPFVSIQNGAIKRRFDYPEIDHTDGIGTKGYYHWQKQTWKNAVLDSLAMNLNDLSTYRARAYKLQNHILIPEEDERLLAIIKLLSEECKKRNIAISGGECAFHNDIPGLEISTTISGFIKKVKTNKPKVNDIIGIKSNGLHSNGFTKVRKVFGKKILPEFTEPTLIYADMLLELDERFDIHQMVHITGGAYTRLRNLLPNADVQITKEHSLVPQNIFKELYKKGIQDEEMYTTFNCGVGFMLFVEKKDTNKIIQEINQQGFQGDIIGELIAGAGKVKIESMFSKKTLIL